MLTVREYLDESGRSLFRDWLERLDLATRARVQARILRQPRRPQAAGRWRLGGATGLRTRLPDLFRQEWLRASVAPARRRQGLPTQRYQTREGSLDDVPEGDATWLEEVRTG